MPRYHLTIEGGRLTRVRNEVPIRAIYGDDKRTKVVVELHAKNPAAAKKLVEDRLPARSNAKVSDAKRI